MGQPLARMAGSGRTGSTARPLSLSLILIESRIPFSLVQGSWERAGCGGGSRVIGALLAFMLVMLKILLIMHSSTA